VKKLLTIRPLWAFSLFIVLDVICIGLGMGVPFFCILLGFVVGWFLVRYITFKISEPPQVFYKVLQYAGMTCAFTFIAMLVLWAPLSSYLFDPAKDLANTGIPMILYEPQASLIGWIVLMVFISPFLQLLTTLFSAYLSLLGWMKSAVRDQKAV